MILVCHRPLSSKPGQSILEIVPQKVERIIDARVWSVDIDVVDTGQQARLHFLAFSACNLPETKGIVAPSRPTARSTK